MDLLHFIGEIQDHKKNITRAHIAGILRYTVGLYHDTYYISTKTNIFQVVCDFNAHNSANGNWSPTERTIFYGNIEKLLKTNKLYTKKAVKS